MAASCLQAGWLTASGVALAQDTLLAGAGKRPWEGKGNRLPAHPPPVCVKGLGTCVPPTTVAPTHRTSQALDTPFPPSLSHLPFPSTQSCSFGSTDGIKTAVSVGPQGEGMVASVPKDHACPQNSETPACHFQRTQGSAGPPHPSNSPQVSHARCPHLSLVL